MTLRIHHRIISVALLTLICMALENFNPPFRVVNLVSLRGFPVFNSREKQILRTLPNKDQILLRKMMAASTPQEIMVFDQQHAGQIHQLTTQYGTAFARFLAASDANQYLHRHPAFKFGPNTHVLKRFPDGSTLEYGESTVKGSSSANPLPEL